METHCPHSRYAAEKHAEAPLDLLVGSLDGSLFGRAVPPPGGIIDVKEEFELFEE